MGLFKGKKLNEHSTSGAGRYLPYLEAEYLVEINRCVGKDGYRGKSAIVEFKILTSSVPDVKPGESFAWINKLEKGDVVLGNIADFVRAGIQVMVCLSDEPRVVQIKNIVPEIIPTDDEFDDEVENVFGEDNPFAKLQLTVKTTPIITDKEKKPFTVHRWTTPQDVLDAAKAAAA